MGRGFGKEVLETAINMKDNIDKIKNKDMVYLFGKMEIYIKAILLMI